MLISKICKTISFRLAVPEDAPFIYNLRCDPRYNTHLSKVDNNLNAQYKWLESYKKRELEGIEYYFIIQKNDSSIPIGTVRLYDFKEDKKSFSWGSWILNENKTPSSAIECALMIYDIGFNSLNFSSCHFEVRKDNEKVLSFHTKCGATCVAEDDKNFYFQLTPDDYIAFRKHYGKYIIGNYL